MKKVYICSPLRGDYEKNIQNALDYCLLAAKAGMMPFAPHVYCTRFLDDEIPAERELGLAMGLEMLAVFEEIWVFGIPSEGMRGEIDRAQELGLKMVFCEVVG